MDVVIGFEGGGTKTECAIVNRDGTLVALGRGGPTNLNFVTREQQRDSLNEALTAATAALKDSTKVVGVGIASPGRTLDLDEAIEALAPGAPIFAYDEHHAALAAAGTLDKFGMALVAGTGSSAVAYRDDEAAIRGGWGSILGDEGGAYWMAVEGLRAAIHQYERDEEDAALPQAVYEHFDLKEMRELVPIVYRGNLQRHELARFAEVVTDLAAQGDDVSMSICQGAVHALATIAIEAASELFDMHEVFPIAVSGSVFGSTLIHDAVVLRIGSSFPNSDIRLPSQPPAQGVALLALRDLGKK